MKKGKQTIGFFFWDEYNILIMQLILNLIFFNFKDNLKVFLIIKYFET